MSFFTKNKKKLLVGAAIFSVVCSVLFNMYVLFNSYVTSKINIGYQMAMSDISVSASQKDVLRFKVLDKDKKEKVFVFKKQ